MTWALFKFWCALIRRNHFGGPDSVTFTGAEADALLQAAIEEGWRPVVEAILRLPVNRDPHNLRQWRSVREIVKAKNPLCQFISKETGKQCAHASEVVHHLVDWKENINLFFEWSNLVALCAEHHAGGQEGETQGNFYVDTLGPCDSIYRHGHGLPHWHSDYVTPENETEQQQIFRMATQGGW